MTAPIGKRRTTATAVLAAALSTATFVGMAARQDEKAEGAAAARTGSGRFQLTAAQWASLRIEPVRTVSFDSVVVADGAVATNDNATVAVFSPFSGRITTVTAQLGQAVHKGDHLLSMLAVEAAQGSADLAATTAAEATGRKQLELAERAEARQHELLLEEAGAEKDWLQSQVDLAAAENSLRAARVALAASRDKVAILGEQSPRRGVGPGQAWIASPIDGVIVQRQVASGQLVSSLASGGSAALFTIADLRTVWILAGVGEVDAARLKLGQSVEVSALALPGRRLRARIAWIASVVDPASHRVAVRAELANPDLALKPQMSVTVRILEGRPISSSAIPSSAVVYDGEQAHCYVVGADRTLTSRPLRVGRTQDGLVEVIAGASVGDQVVTRGALFIDHATEEPSS